MAISSQPTTSDRLVAGEADVVLTRRRTEPSRQGEVELRHALIIAAAVLTVAAGIVHLAFAPDHIHEYVPYGLGFYSMAVAQLAVGVVLAIRRRSKALLAATIGLNLGICVLWSVTRTVGLPVGPEPWKAEAVGVADLACVGFQVAAAALLLPFVLTATRLSRLVQRTVSVRTAVAMVTAVAVLAAPLTFHASRTGHEDHSAAEMEQR